MAAFHDAPAAVIDDLLYLTYIDSLARDGRALPVGVPAQGLMAQHLVLLAGTSRRTATTWGLFPPTEEG